MNINRENYEMFFLDYFEGAISEEAKVLLFAFLDQNPDLKEEFYGFENISLTDTSENITYDFKESLKKQDLTSRSIITQANYHEFFIADIEGDLKPSQKKQLDLFISNNTELFAEYQLYKSIKLIPDKSILFDGKNKLKRFVILGMPIKKIILLQAVSIAASLLLIASVSTYYFQNTRIENIPIATVSTAKYHKDISNTDKNNVLKNTAVVIAKNTGKKVIETNIVDNKFKSAVNKQMNGRSTLNINALASKEISRIPITTKTSQSFEENRIYYTRVVDLMAFSDEKTDNKNFELSSDNFKSTILNSDFVKDQPIAEAGSFLKNFAIVSLSKIEALGSDIKDSYQAVEKRFERK